MGIRTIRDQLDDAFHDLTDRYHIVFLPTAPPRHGLETTTLDAIASALVADQMAPTKAREIIYALNPEPTFWGTPLGRMLYLASGGRPYGEDFVDHPLADNLLGMSRQAVDWLIPSGRIVRLPGVPVRFTADSLLTLFKSRNPEGVPNVVAE